MQSCVLVIDQVACFQCQVNDSVPVSLVASDLNLPGLYLLHDFVNAKEEEVRSFSSVAGFCSCFFQSYALKCRVLCEK